MSTTDLSILADAVTFAILVAIGGAIAYAVARAAWKRHSLRQTAKVGLSAAALVAVGLAGVAVWPTARDGVSSAADIAGFEVPTVDGADEGPAFFTNPSYVASPPTGRAARVWQAAPGGATPGGLDISPPPDTNSSSSPIDPSTGPPSDTDSTEPPTTTTTTPPTTTTTTPPPTTTTTTPPPTTTTTTPPPTDTTTTQPPTDTNTTQPPQDSPPGDSPPPDPGV